MTNPISTCCNAPVKYENGVEGTNYCWCSKCEKACDWNVPQNTQKEDEIINGNVWRQSCKGCGFHDSIWKTLVESPQWREWYKYASKNTLYDVDETQELGVMSQEHFQDFIKFLKGKKK